MPPICTVKKNDTAQLSVFQIGKSLTIKNIQKVSHYSNICLEFKIIQLTFFITNTEHALSELFKELCLSSSNYFE